MNTRYLLIGTAAVAFAGVASAAPLKSEPAESRPTEHQPTQVVLASAEQVRSAVPAAQPAAAAPAKRRAARVTTCRCAGQTPGADQANQ